MALITVTGNLGSDPELKITPTGKSVTEFSLAENHRRKNPDGQWEDIGTTWYDVTAWDRLAERAAELLSKGHTVRIEGEFQTRDYTKQDGTAGIALEITARTITLPLAGSTTNQEDNQ
jgi:single-strand DNA-binding protein